MDKIFTLHTDPGHGWLEVSRADLWDVGLIPSNFSTYSMFDSETGNLFLEEDSDAPKFIEAFKRMKGFGPDILEKYLDDNPVRYAPHLQDSPGGKNRHV